MIYLYMLQLYATKAHPRYLAYLTIFPLAFGVVCTFSPFVWVRVIGVISYLFLFSFQWAQFIFDQQKTISAILAESINEDDGD